MARAMTVNWRLNACGVVVAGCMLTVSAAGQNTTPTKYTVRTLSLPDNGVGDVSMDYIAFDPSTNSLWVPGGNTGAVDVVDVASGSVRQIPNLATRQVQTRGGTRVLGPSGVSIGQDVVYVGQSGRFGRLRVQLALAGPRGVSIA